MKSRCNSIVFILAVAIICLSSRNAKAHLCESSEEVYFSCELKDVRSEVSLCGNSSNGILQFRQTQFGKLSVIYPKQPSNSLKKFTKKQITDRTGSPVSLVTFQKGLHAYEIFTKKNASDSYQGIVIKRAPHMEFLNKYICEDSDQVGLKTIAGLR